MQKPAAGSPLPKGPENWQASPDPLRISSPVWAAAHSTRSERDIRAAARLRGLTGSDHPLYLNFWRNSDRHGRPTHLTADVISGEYARASAAEDVRENEYDAGILGTCRYESTVRLNADGTYDVLDLSRGA